MYFDVFQPEVVVLHLLFQEVIHTPIPVLIMDVALYWVVQGRIS
jgi:hypothetical protein